jgi:hypothetical protein
MNRLYGFIVTAIVLALVGGAVIFALTSPAKASIPSIPAVPVGHGEWESALQGTLPGENLEEAADAYAEAWRQAGWTVEVSSLEYEGLGPVYQIDAHRSGCRAEAEVAVREGEFLAIARVWCGSKGGD